MEALTRNVRFRQRVRTMIQTKPQSIILGFVALFVGIGGLFMFFAITVLSSIFIGFFTERSPTEVEQWEVASSFPKEAQKYLPIYMEAGEKYGVPWHILAGIHKVETNFGQNLSVSPVGAKGHTQVRP